jgi:hypothetical protein
MVSAGFFEMVTVLSSNTQVNGWSLNTSFNAVSSDTALNSTVTGFASFSKPSS